VKAWGKVRTELVKRIARELVERFPEKFTTDFENNKKLVESLTNISSKKLRNKVAGYITQLQDQKKQNKLTTEQKEIIS
jgi:small subunit ribosomal protein S17e